MTNVMDDVNVRHMDFLSRSLQSCKTQTCMNEPAATVPSSYLAKTALLLTNHITADYNDFTISRLCRHSILNKPDRSFIDSSFSDEPR